MVKRKSGQTAPLATNKEKVHNDHVESSNVGIEDLHEDDWVIVKKQKITILIPPIELPLQQTLKGLRSNKVSAKFRKSKRSRAQVLNEVNPRTRSGKLKNSFDERSWATVPNRRKNITRPTLKSALEGPERVCGKSTAHLSSSKFVNDHNMYGGLGSSKPLMVYGGLKAAKRQNTCHQGSTVLLRPISCFSVTGVQNRMIRASNLERKLEKVGGLTRWLMSLGLGQFVMMFRRANVTKFQLSNLTMEKLKDMGANAVGPRRKLIHAIDCLSHPYCLNKLLSAVEI
ncbi:hypothetical protein IFM89_000333 [Coptis chinensis]|uniref:SAM domain-containing protein n=1 Tax=Coptis chinensis TaxID=261450 RepID=A0A835H838_9MAGN|nr:hypothetical protein IFM89_000333 [Coptis chinensis]